MHPQSSALTIRGTVLKESDELVILGVTFESKITFEKHHRSVSSAATLRLSISRKSWQLFHDRLLLGRCFRTFVRPILEYSSAVWCSAADTHQKRLDSVVSGDSFLTGGVFWCDLALTGVGIMYAVQDRSGVTRCTLFMVLDLSCMCRCVSHTVL